MDSNQQEVANSQQDKQYRPMIRCHAQGSYHSGNPEVGKSEGTFQAPVVNKESTGSYNECAIDSDSDCEVKVQGEQRKLPKGTQHLLHRPIQPECGSTDGGRVSALSLLTSDPTRSKHGMTNEQDKHQLRRRMMIRELGVRVPGDWSREEVWLLEQLLSERRGLCPKPWKHWDNGGTGPHLS